jgi:hypothetical protein
MRSQRTSNGLLAAAIAAWLLVPAAPAQEAERELNVQHAECSLFGPKRERFVRGGQLAAGREAQILSATSTEVAQALPALPSRSRSGALQISTPLTELDEILFTAMRTNGITPVGPCTDQEFIRRVTLDLTGRIPTVSELTAFLGDSSPNKREALVERLLASPAWVDKWTMYFGDLLGNAARTAQVNRFPSGRNAFYNWIKTSLQQNKPYDQMARELLAATGQNSYEQGELNFLVGGFMGGGPPQDTYDRQAAEAATVFLGIAHMDCLLCHDGRGHLDSLSVWGRSATRFQAWGLAGFFARTQLTRVPVTQGQPNPYYWSVLDNFGRARTDYTLNTTTGNRPERQPRPTQPRTVAPVYPFSGRGPNPGEPYRTALAREITSDFQFARAAVNYIWKQFFGITFVEPPDQFDPARLDPNNPPPEPWTIQPSNPQALQKLAQDFVNSRYNLKSLMRQIVNSRVYQLSSRVEGVWNSTWDRYYARHLVRRLDAEEIHDSLVIASGVTASYNIQGIGTVNWAMQFPETANMPAANRNNTGLGAVTAFLDSFIRGDRDDVERSRETALPQALDLMNDNFVLTRARAGTRNSLLANSLSQPDDQLVTTLWLNVLSRNPTDAERAIALERLRSGGAAQRTRNAENLLWALYNKIDFIFNY